MSANLFVCGEPMVLFHEESVFEIVRGKRGRFTFEMRKIGTRPSNRGEEGVIPLSWAKRPCFFATLLALPVLYSFFSDVSVRDSSKVFCLSRVGTGQIFLLFFLSGFLGP